MPTPLRCVPDTLLAPRTEKEERRLIASMQAAAGHFVQSFKVDEKYLREVGVSRLLGSRLCRNTGNPCGTDTWRVGTSCSCENCQKYIAEGEV